MCLGARNQTEPMELEDSRVIETEDMETTATDSHHRHGSWWRWKPTSSDNLAEAEKKVLANVWHLTKSKFVHIENGTNIIRTLTLNGQSTKTPLLMVHGMGSGVGLWVLNLPSLSEHRPVYAIDVLGFGRSSRPKFSKDHATAEQQFVNSIEEWRKAMKLDKFILLGHSLGGFISMAYAIRYPEHVRHLILADPWGFAEKPPESERQSTLPFYVKFVLHMGQYVNPFGVVRAIGPWGPGLISRIRPDLVAKFSDLYDDDTVSQYIYHCNAQHPSGEAVFKHLSKSIGFARQPMVGRIKDIHKDLPITFINGADSWMKQLKEVCSQFQTLRQDSYINVQFIKDAGHHVYADEAERFNYFVNRTCQLVDTNQDNIHSTHSSDQSQDERL